MNCNNNGPAKDKEKNTHNRVDKEKEDQVTKKTYKYRWSKSS